MFDTHDYRRLKITMNRKRRNRRIVLLVISWGSFAALGIASVMV